MSKGKEKPERMRENLKQEEIKRNPTGNLNDAFNRNEAGNLSGLAGSLLRVERSRCTHSCNCYRFHSGIYIFKVIQTISKRVTAD